jgi:hypothetical protein
MITYEPMLESACSIARLEVVQGTKVAAIRTVTVTVKFQLEWFSWLVQIPGLLSTSSLFCHLTTSTPQPYSLLLQRQPLFQVVVLGTV